MYNLTDKSIVLGVTGSIAIYKACDLASKLTQAGAKVYVVMTPEATKFVSPITFQSLTGRAAYADVWAATAEVSEIHVALGRSADLMVIAPATATIMARLALGLPEELVSLTAHATRAPLVLCPAMDPHMWQHPATHAHWETLWRRGVEIVGPEEGRLASGQIGWGRMSEVDKIMGAVRKVAGRDGDLRGRKVVVSAGGTHEAIDPVRYVGNHSSGKMGFAVAEAARDRGADVVLVSGPVALADPYGVDVTRVDSAAEMLAALQKACSGADALIMAAAVADYRPADQSGQKIKRKASEGMTLSLVPTPDIVSEIGRPKGLVKVGFAAESEDLVANAKKKIGPKGLDLIVANDITAPDSGFGTDTNRVVIIDEQGGQEELPLMTKYEVGWRILDRVAALMKGKR